MDSYCGLILFVFFLCSCTNNITSPSHECEYLYVYKKDLCSNKIQISITIDSSFSNKEYQLIEESLSIWERFSDNHVQFSLTGLQSHESLLNYADNLSILRITKSEYKKLDIPEKPSGLYFQNYIYLMVDRFPDRNHFRAILVHEIGHYIGLSHYDSKFSIMNPIVAENFCIYNSGMPTKLDFYQLKKVLCFYEKTNQTNIAY